MPELAVFPSSDLEIEASITQDRVRGLPELRRDPAAEHCPADPLGQKRHHGHGRAGRDPQGSRPLWAVKRT